MSVLKILNEVAATSSKLEKQAILEKNKKNDMLKRVIFLALDPFTQFYIRKIPEYKTVVARGSHNLNYALDQLEVLSTRKATGHAAINHLKYLLENIDSHDDAKVIERIIAKDLKAGFAESTTNKVWPGLIHEYPVMLASGYDEKLIKKMHFPAFAQLKFDGMRFNAIVEKGKVTYRSRNGKPIDLLGNMEDDFIKLASSVKAFTGKNFVFDGELVVVDEKGNILDRKTGNGILNKAIKGTISDEEASRVRARLWDIIPVEDFRKGIFAQPYSTRLQVIESCVFGYDKIKFVDTHNVKDIDEAQKLFNKYLAKGEEGIILKNPFGIWEDKRASHQIKFKSEKECDLLCVDWYPGEPGTKYEKKLGGLTLESSDGIIKVNVGSGFTDEMRDKYTKKNTVGKIIAVKYNDRIVDKNTGQESLFLPVFLEVREDKTKADSSKAIK